MITSSGKFRASLKEGQLWAQIVSSFAGYIGDQLICGLPDDICMLRSTSDRSIRASMKTHVHKDIDWQELCDRAENVARILIENLQSEIIEFAIALEPFWVAKRDLTPEVVEDLPCIQKARSLGKLSEVQQD